MNKKAENDDYFSQRRIPSSKKAINAFFAPKQTLSLKKPFSKTQKSQISPTTSRQHTTYIPTHHLSQANMRMPSDHVRPTCPTHPRNKILRMDIAKNLGCTVRLKYSAPNDRLLYQFLVWGCRIAFCGVRYGWGEVWCFGLR